MARDYLGQRAPVLAGPATTPGGVRIDTAARVAALDCLLDDVVGTGSDLTPGNADLLIDYVADLFERDDVDLALRALCHYMDLTAAYRLTAVLHTCGGRDALR